MRSSKVGCRLVPKSCYSSVLNSLVECWGVADVAPVRGVGLVGWGRGGRGSLSCNWTLRGRRSLHRLLLSERVRVTCARNQHSFRWEERVQQTLCGPFVLVGRTIIYYRRHHLPFEFGMLILQGIYTSYHIYKPNIGFFLRYFHARRGLTTHMHYKKNLYNKLNVNLPNRYNIMNVHLSNGCTRGVSKVSYSMVFKY